MARFIKLVALLSLAATVGAVTVAQRHPLVIRGAKTTVNGSDSQVPDSGVDINTANPTDSNTIAATAQQVDQKTGPTDDAPPSNDVPPTVITAVDGDVTPAGESGDALLNVLHDPDSQPDLNTGSTVSKKRDVSLRKRGGYEQVFGGTGTGPSDRDTSIQGTAYLTFTRLDTYDLGACEAFCDGIEACVFVNLFYEYNSDAMYNPQIKCAAYGDIHSASEKTNFGGQQLLPPPAGVTYIQQSVGYAADFIADPPTPYGYTLVFGPTNGANQAPGYMGFAFLDKYDVQACAILCDTRGPDSVGGVCQYFNIWRAIVNGNPTTYTCAMYYLPTDASTATNTGQGDLQVTYSRGYTRTCFVPDSGFEDYAPCLGSGGTNDGCLTQSDATWTGNTDSAIFDFTGYSHMGHSAGSLGNPFGNNGNPGSYTPASPLITVAGYTYQITVWYTTYFNGPTLEADATINVLWNGNNVFSQTGYTPQYVYANPTTVTAAGNDVLTIAGGGYPNYVFFDDVCVWTYNNIAS